MFNKKLILSFLFCLQAISTIEIQSFGCMRKSFGRVANSNFGRTLSNAIIYSTVGGTIGGGMLYFGGKRVVDYVIETNKEKDFPVLKVGDLPAL